MMKLYWIRAGALLVPHYIRGERFGHWDKENKHGKAEADIRVMLPQNKECHGLLATIGS